MDQIFDRLGNLLKSTLRANDDVDHDIDGYTDPDLQEAWDELNDFLAGDSDTAGGTGPGFQRSSFGSTNRSASIPPQVAEAYSVIGVSAHVSNAELGKAYKTLLLKHHPDRVAGDPAKMAAATERTKRINRAFQEIKSHRANP